MAFFMPSSMGKRLLKYGLSYVDVLDLDSLDLDSLDISLGSKSVVEFNDVGVKLKKVERMLSLPQDVELVKGRIGLLRITIPVDIHSSPILVEVSNVEVHVKVQTNPTGHGQARKAKAARARSPGPEDLPTAEHLAESFLQAETAEERAELEAALLAQSQASLSTEDDDESVVGTGTGIALPEFIANFFKGVVDRLQVKMSDMTLSVDINVPGDEKGTEMVTVQMVAEDVNIQGVTFDRAGSDAVEDGDNKVNGLPLKDGKRLVSMHSLRGLLISDAGFLTSLARSTAKSMASTAGLDSNQTSRQPSVVAPSEGTMSPPPSSRKSARSMPASPQLSTPPHSPLAASAILSPLALSSSMSPLESSIGGHSSMTVSGRFDDAVDEDEEGDNEPPDFGPEYGAHSSIGSLANSALLENITDSRFLDSEHEENPEADFPFAKPDGMNPLESPSHQSTPRASLCLSQEQKVLGKYQNPASLAGSARLGPVGNETPPVVEHVEHPGPPSRHDISELEANKVPQERHQSMPQRRPDISRDNLSQSSASSSSTDGQLTESRLFTHEDAESMYMSAISHGSETDRMPGAWGHSTMHVPEPAQTSRSENNSPDNLEHIRRSLLLESPERAVITGDGHESVASLAGTEVPDSPSKSGIASQRGFKTVQHTTSYLSEPSTASSEGEVRMGKQLFSLDHVGIYLPPVNSTSSGQDEQPASAASAYGQASMARSVAPNVPGTFSVHSTVHRERYPRGVPDAPKFQETQEATNVAGSDVEIVLGQLYAQFDVAVARVLYRVFTGLSSLFGAHKPQSNATNATRSENSTTSLRFKAERLSLKFLNRLAASRISKKGLCEDPWLKPLEADVLLRTTLKGLDLNYGGSQKETNIAVALQKFVFGYARENILSFDSSLSMRQSVRDLSATAGVDIKFDYRKTLEATRCSISTLPLHVSINLQRLDETFGWLGGLSSVINMTASMGQSVMMTTPSPTKPKRKGVSFDTPIKPDDESPGSASENKIDARIGGFVLDLIGKDCSIAIDTTALKVVSRDEGLGLAIDKIKLTGPHVRVIGGDPAIFAEVSGTRIEFLSSPKGSDLDRLLALITPSKTKFDPDDDVMIDPLVRQRRQGSVLRVTVDHFLSRITQIEQLKYLPELGEELAKLSTVAKYLPEDDRPGLLSLVLIRDLDASVDLAANIGVVRGKVTDLQVAHITFPALIAGSVLNMTVDRNSSEELLGIGVSTDHLPAKDHAPMIMGRWIGDEPHPKIKLKLNNLKADYRVSTIMAFLNLDYATGEELLAGVAESIVTLTDRVSRSIPSLTERPQSIIPVHDGPEVTPPVIELHVAIRDCILGLNPYGSPSKMLFVMSEAQIEGALNQDQTITALVEMVRSSILVIDDISNVVPKSRMTPNRRYSYDGGSLAVNDLCSQGYVSVGSLSEAKVHITVKPSANPEHDDKFIDVAFTDDLIVLESCADSTQTLFSILGALSPPTPPSKRKTAKYRTTTMPLDDLLASFSGDAFEAPDVEFDVEKAFGSRVMSESDVDTANLELDEDFYGIDHSHHSPNATSHHGSVLFDGEGAQEHDDGVLLESFTSKQHVHTHEPLVFLEDHFDSKSYSEQTSVLWNSDTGEFEPSDFKTKDSPFKVVVTNVHLIWNLFDGYDWQHTRDVIAKSAQDVENKATQKRKQKKRKSNSQATDMDSDEDETVIGDFLFNSIYIGIPGNRDPAELTGLINERLGVDNATETESVAQTQASISSKRPGVGTPKSTAKKLRLKRSKHHKMAIELKGVDVNFLTVPQGSHETEAIASIRVKDLTIFDHMPTSTWKKFATYAHDHGQREAGASQLSIDMAIVRPVASLPVTEFAIKANILPLRIHADQDAVEFIERFFAFKDERGPASDPESDPPFIQKCEVLEIPVLLDFKPKRVDYGGLRAGNTTELMNFIILDTSRMKLRHAIVRGCPGFDRLGKCLNDLWMPDVKASQLPGVLAGLAPIRSAANIGDGVAELIRVPMREYKKDGRLMRALGKGALRFAKTSGTEVVKLSAKVAIGTQNILEGAEELLAPERAERSNRTRAISAGWDEDGESDDDDDGNDGKGKVISLYADQPVNVIQGAKTAWRGLERDLMVARDAVIAVPGEVRESGSAMGAGKAVLKAAPTIVLRPMVGVSKALGKALLGAGNTLDPENLRRAEDKYKRY